MRIKVKVDVDKKKLLAAPAAVHAALETAMNDVADDLVRASSGAAPHDKGVLEKSWNKKVSVSALKGVVEVSYSAHHNGFNYAIAMHEGSYKLGPGSLAKPGGVGMSGTTYRVGPKFLERPLLGEKITYQKHISKHIAAALEALD
jgi:hypothetical protein